MMWKSKKKSYKAHSHEPIFIIHKPKITNTTSFTPFIALTLLLQLTSPSPSPSPSWSPSP
jgi:hypothetical protein